MTQLVNENKKKTGTLPFRLLLIAAGAGILLKLFVSYLFPLSRLLLRFVVCPLLLILIILTILKAGGRQRKKRVLCGVALAVGAIIFSFLPIDRQLEQARFQTSKSWYSSAAAAGQKKIKDKGTEKGTVQLSFPDTLLVPGYNGEVDYLKAGNSVAIAFHASASLSVQRFFVYVSDETAKEVLRNPRKYYGSSFTGAVFQQQEALSDSHWLYAFTWGSDLPPSDPNI